MTREAIKAELTDRQVLTCTLVGEVLNEPLDGVMAVAGTIRNRVLADIHSDHKPDWWGEGYKGVCLKAWQFSCWHERNTNTDRVFEVAESLILDRASKLVPAAKLQALTFIADATINGSMP